MFHRNMKKLAKLLATVFYIGFIPIAPGTAASIAALFLYVAMKGDVFFHTTATLFFLIAGFWAAGITEKELGKKDPPQIVIDEFASMLLVYFFVPFNWKYIITGFFLFRILDVIKIPPIRKLEALPAAFGIMTDDIACAMLTNIILQVLKTTPLLF
ncbi:MAG: phosphatidylglycerophosphatase A [Candidatus Omnitrophica bacterium]|nr:phosphatidylglycerophosphatase A [Candidatus Omnitrophota bacterium]